MSAANIVIAIFFSIVGFAALRYGKREGELRPALLGAALMFYGYFGSNAWLSLLVGAARTALIFFPQ